MLKREYFIDWYRGMSSFFRAFKPVLLITDFIPQLRFQLPQIITSLVEFFQADEQWNALDRDLYFANFGNLATSGFGAGSWYRNTEMFQNRFGKCVKDGPERLQNIYFVYLLELRALAKAAPYIRRERLFHVGNEKVAIYYDTLIATSQASGKNSLYISNF